MLTSAVTSPQFGAISPPIRKISTLAVSPSGIADTLTLLSQKARIDASQDAIPLYWEQARQSLIKGSCHSITVGNNPFSRLIHTQIPNHPGVITRIDFLDSTPIIRTKLRTAQKAALAQLEGWQNSKKTGYIAKIRALPADFIDKVHALILEQASQPDPSRILHPGVESRHIIISHYPQHQLGEDIRPSLTPGRYALLTNPIRDFEHDIELLVGTDGNFTLQPAQNMAGIIDSINLRS